MNKESDTTLNESQKGELEPNRIAEKPIRREVYPAVSNRMKQLAGWLMIAFIVAVILVQQFSGYS